MSNRVESNLHQEIDPDSAATRLRGEKSRLVGVDAARGLALIGLISVHILPSWDEETGEPSLSWLLFSGDSAALFALLAGVGLALSTSKRTPHRGRMLVADRVGLVLRAVLIAAVGLLIGYLMPEDAPADGILLYYGVFFMLAIPFLHLGRVLPDGVRTLFQGSTMHPLDSPGSNTDVRVVVDGDGQPCLWPTDCPVPPGWTDRLCPPLWEEAQAYLRAQQRIPPQQNPPS